MAQLTRFLLALVLPLACLTAAAQPVENALIIDTRSPAEFESGHIEGAVLIPYDAIEAGIVRVTDDKDAPIYLYCGSGKRADIARQSLQRRGYTNVTNLGGLDDARAFFTAQE